MRSQARGVPRRSQAPPPPARTAARSSTSTVTYLLPERHSRAASTRSSTSRSPTPRRDRRSSSVASASSPDSEAVFPRAPLKAYRADAQDRRGDGERRGAANDPEIATCVELSAHLLRPLPAPPRQATSSSSSTASRTSRAAQSPLPDYFGGGDHRCSRASRSAAPSTCSSPPRAARSTSTSPSSWPQGGRPTRAATFAHLPLRRVENNVPADPSRSRSSRRGARSSATSTSRRTARGTTWGAGTGDSSTPKPRRRRRRCAAASPRSPAKLKIDGREGEGRLRLRRHLEDALRCRARSSGIHGFRPYRRAQIFARRFGDCKDKAATPIVTMPGGSGIRRRS